MPSKPKKITTFLRKSKKRYAKEYCNVLSDALDCGKENEYIIDMDEVADILNGMSEEDALLRRLCFIGGTCMSTKAAKRTRSTSQKVFT